MSIFFLGCGQDKESPFDVPVSEAGLSVPTFDAPPNVLLVTLDTCRADRIGCYGFHFAHTQAIDGMAEEGVRCDNAIAAAPITLPSHSTILTGLLPPAHGVRDNGAYVLSDKAVTLAEHLKTAGYSTHAVVSAEVLNRRYNLNQGFDEYSDELWDEERPPTFMVRDRSAQKTSAVAVEMLDRWHEQSKEDLTPFFMWIHLFDPHLPWDANVPKRELLPTAYDAEIAQADDGIERVVAWLREKEVLDNTLVVITSDHGEGLGEHKEKTHSIFVYDSTVKVPMVWRFPGKLPAGVSTDAPVHHADMLPTILSLLDLPAGEKTQGRDITSLLKGEPSSESSPQYSESLLAEVGFGMAPLFAVRHEGYKYIEAPRPELYDLEADPKELTNVYAEMPERAAALKKVLHALIAESEAFALPSEANAMDETTLEMLEALGYLSGEGERASMAGMDPKDGIVLHEMLSDARHLVQQKKYKAAEKKLRELLRQSPKHSTGYNVLGMVLVNQNRIEEGEQAYAESLAINANQFRIVYTLALLKLKANKAEEAIALFEQTIELQPRFIEAMVSLAIVADEIGDAETADTWTQKALTESPDSPLATMFFANLYFKNKNYVKAYPYYIAALAIQSDHYEAMVEGGLCQLRLGHYDAAIEHLEQARATRPDSWQAYYDLACAHALKGNSAKSLELLRTMLAEEDTSLGLNLAGAIAKDSDLKSLRGLPEFDTLVKEYRKESKE